MLKILARLLIKNHENYADAKVRQGYGMLCGGLGIFLNLLLAGAKLVAGSLSHSIAVTADALNNLSDAVSSLVTLVGFRLAGRASDQAHPFGHGRSEYIAGLIVAMAILMVGLELLQSSVQKIMAPALVAFSPAALAILLASIAVKLYMLAYNRAIGKKISSAAMKAVAMDSLADTAATTVALLSMALAHWYGLALDGYAGLLVSLFILYTGVMAAKDIISPLLGAPPDPDFVRQVHELVLAHSGISGLHDLIVHDYGPGRRMVSLHAEVPAEGDVMALHDAIDHIENELSQALGCQAVIHMDPVRAQDPEANALRQAIAERLSQWHENLTLHDFRLVQRAGYCNVIFDVVAPYELSLSATEIQARVRTLVREVRLDLVAVVSVDRPYSYE